MRLGARGCEALRSGWPHRRGVPRGYAARRSLPPTSLLRPPRTPRHLDVAVSFNSPADVGDFVTDYGSLLATVGQMEGSFLADIVMTVASDADKHHNVGGEKGRLERLRGVRFARASQGSPREVPLASTSEDNAETSARSASTSANVSR